MVRNLYNCECGGLRHICHQHGHLPGSREHYRARNGPAEYMVVWSGRGELLDGRAEHPDSRIWSMPTYDLDDGEVANKRPSRRYSLTGKHSGKFSRTDPSAPHFKPTVRPKPDAAPDSVREEQPNG